MGPQGPYGPIWAPTRTGPQPGLGPNPDWAPTRARASQNRLEKPVRHVVRLVLQIVV